MILSATGSSLFRAHRTDKYRKIDQLSDREIEAMLNSIDGWHGERLFVRKLVMHEIDDWRWMFIKEI